MKRICNNCKEETRLFISTCPHCGGSSFEIVMRLLPIIIRKSKHKTLVFLFLSLCGGTFAQNDQSANDTLCFTAVQKGHYDDGYLSYDFVATSGMKLWINGSKVTGLYWLTETDQSGDIVGEADYSYDGQRVGDMFYLNEYYTNEMDGDEFVGETVWQYAEGRFLRVGNENGKTPTLVKVACK